MLLLTVNTACAAAFQCLQKMGFSLKVSKLGRNNFFYLVSIPPSQLVKDEKMRKSSSSVMSMACEGGMSAMCTSMTPMFMEVSLYQKLAISKLHKLRW
jgi:hypothetical protein